MRINYFTIVWGEEYIEKFAKYTMPSILSDVNTDAFEGNNYYIYTDNPNLFDKYPIFDKLKIICNVIFLGLIGGERDKILIECTKDILIRSVKDKDIVGIIPPDAIYSDNSFINMFNKIREGYEAVILPFGAMRVDESKFSNNGTNTVDSFLENIHIETLNHFTSSKKFFYNPIMRIDDNRVVKSFYHQPSFVKANKVSEFTNLELDFVNSLVDADKVYAVKDSSEAFQFSLTKEKYSGYAENEYNEETFLYINKYNINSISELSYESGFAIL